MANPYAHKDENWFRSQVGLPPLGQDIPLASGDIPIDDGVYREDNPNLILASAVPDASYDPSTGEPNASASTPVPPPAPSQGNQPPWPTRDYNVEANPQPAGAKGLADYEASKGAPPPMDFGQGNPTLDAYERSKAGKGPAPMDYSAVTNIAKTAALGGPQALMSAALAPNASVPPPNASFKDQGPPPEMNPSLAPQGPPGGTPGTPQTPTTPAPVQTPRTQVGGLAQYANGIPDWLDKARAQVHHMEGNVSKVYREGAASVEREAELLAKRNAQMAVEEKAALEENARASERNQRALEAAQDAAKKYREQTDRYIDEVANTEVDPNRVYGRMDLGAKLAVIVGSALGGVLMGGGYTKENEFIKSMDKVISDDIRAQEHNLATKKWRINQRETVYEQMRREGIDQKTAADLYAEGIYKRALKMAEINAKDFDSKIAQENLKRMGLAYDEKRTGFQLQRADKNRAEAEDAYKKMLARLAAGDAREAQRHKDFLEMKKFYITQGGWNEDQAARQAYVDIYGYEGTKFSTKDLRDLHKNDRAAGQDHVSTETRFVAEKVAPIAKLRTLVQDAIDSVDDGPNNPASTKFAAEQPWMYSLFDKKGAEAEQKFTRATNTLMSREQGQAINPAEQARAFAALKGANTRESRKQALKQTMAMLDAEEAAIRKGVSEEARQQYDAADGTRPGTVKTPRTTRGGE